MTYVWVALGSAIGGLGRYWLSLWIDSRAAGPFPFGTLAVNVIGSCLIGVVLGMLPREAIAAHAFLVVGVLGGFTTFSAFSAQNMLLLRAGEVGTSLLYIATSVFLCLFAVFAGQLAARWIVH